MLIVDEHCLAELIFDCLNECISNRLVLNSPITLGYTLSSEAFEFVPQVGVFEIVSDPMEPENLVNAQVVLMPPVAWCSNLIPVTIGGDYNRFTNFLLLLFSNNNVT